MVAQSSLPVTGPTTVDVTSPAPTPRSTFSRQSARQGFCKTSISARTPITEPCQTSWGGELHFVLPG
jgi:hypothetical protein